MHFMHIHRFFNTHYNHTSIDTMLLINLHISFLFFFLVLVLVLVPTVISTPPPSNFTLFGTAHINQTTITLTQPLSNCTSHSPLPPNTGRIFFKNPISFFAPNASFSTRFSFLITPPPQHCLPGEGIAFLITPHTNSLPYSLGSLGLPEPNSNSNNPNPFLAVEFDTNYDKRFNDINDNHVGIDLGSVFSVASTDLMSVGIDLNGGKIINAWIEYNGKLKVLKIWVGYMENKPDSPILTAPIDVFSKRLNGLMYVGFSGSNGYGSSVHLINSWVFKTFESDMYPGLEVEQVGFEDCLICFPDPGKKAGPGSEPGLRKTQETKGVKLAILLLVLNLVIVSLILSGVVWYVYLTKNKSQTKSQGQSESQQEQTVIRTFQHVTNTMPRRVKLSEIRSMTNCFNRNLIIGDGVSAVVYKTDRNMAVKRFKMASFGSQMVTEFVNVVSSLQHKNLMKLKGWCCERSELILVYDYMPNGSLDKVLHKRTVNRNSNRNSNGNGNGNICFGFEARLNVLIGVALALVYLHEECDRLIVHRNVKSSNILLDLNFLPKLGDFGLTGLCENMARDVTVPARDMGYLAPEYVYSRVPTVKTDVYSFGVVVLEVATGREAVDGNGVVVTDWVWDLWEEKRLVAAADSGLGGVFDKSAMEMVLMIGLSCVHPNYRMRPTMKEVLGMLKGGIVPCLPEVKPTVVIQSLTEERLPDVAVKGGGGGDDGVTSWGTPASHFSKN